MLEFEATTAIDAPPERVWEVLMDSAAYPEWDPYAERIEGRIVLGGKVTAFTTLAPGRAFRVTVSELEAPRRMAWSSGMPLGLFKGVRTFSLTPKDGGGTEFTVREEFTGPMLTFIRSSLPDMTEPFQAFVAGLKERAEAGSAPQSE